MTSTSRAMCAVAVLLLGGAPAQAYQPGEVFRLDLKAAMVSPQPIGPPAQFEPAPAPVQAMEEPAKTATAPKAAAKSAQAARPAIAKPPAVAKPRVAAKPRPAAKSKTARRSNPLDANAADTRMQVWPCRSGGICNWRK